jgi:hypothetical protein
MSDKRRGVIVKFPTVQIMKLLVTKFSPAFSSCLPLTSKYALQHLVFRHPQAIDKSKAIPVTGLGDP